MMAMMINGVRVAAVLVCREYNSATTVTIDTQVTRACLALAKKLIK